MENIPVKGKYCRRIGCLRRFKRTMNAGWSVSMEHRWRGYSAEWCIFIFAVVIGVSAGGGMYLKKLDSSSSETPYDGEYYYMHALQVNYSIEFIIDGIYIFIIITYHNLWFRSIFLLGTSVVPYHCFSFEMPCHAMYYIVPMYST